MKDEFDQPRTGSVDGELAMALAAVPTVLYRCLDDDAWTMRYISEDVRSLTGYDVAEIVDPHPVTTFESLIHPDDRAAVRHAVTEAVRRHTTFRVNYRLVRRDGAVRWMWEHGRAVEPEGGRWVLGGCIADVTDIVEGQRRLAESESRLRKLVDSTPDGIVLSAGGTITFVNPAAAKLIGVAAESVVGHDVLEFITDEHRSLVLEAGRHTEALGSDFGPREYSLVRPDGQRCEVDALSVAMRVGGRPGTQTVIRDITERRREERLRESNLRVLSATSAGAGVHELLKLVAETLEGHLSGRQVSALLLEGAAVRHVASSSLPQRYLDAVAALPASHDIGPWHTARDAGRPLVVADLGAENRWARFREVALEHDLAVCWAVPVELPGSGLDAVLCVHGTRDGQPTPLEWGIIMRFRELTSIAVDHAVARDRLRYDAFHDDLTGLPNRAAVKQILGDALTTTAEAGAVGVLFVGLDQFRAINDSLGHEVGDEVLRAVAHLLGAAVRSTDVVARFSGDEFVVCCPLVEEGQLEPLASRLHDVLAVPFRVRGQDVYLSATVGIAVSIDGLDSAEDLLSNANVAMHQAKRSHPGTHRRFDDALRDRAVRRLRLESDLRRAVERSELRLNYQPEVDLATGTVFGVEALLRWRHPTEGLIPPDEFIGLAEQNGSIVAIGEWVLREACRQAAVWRDAGAPTMVSVNLSPLQLADAALVDAVAGALRASHLDPSLLCLELTETAVMEDAADAAQRLAELKRLGVTLAIDDFGTGYSSLVYLKRFPVDFLKIDRSFVAGIPDSDDDLQIVSAVVSLATSLGIAVIAEGIETPAQMAALVAMGCGFGQGYVWSRPVPPGPLPPDIALVRACD